MTYTIKTTTEQRAFGGILEGKPLEMRKIEVYQIFCNGVWINETRDLDMIGELIADHKNPGRWANVGNRFD